MRWWRSDRNPSAPRALPSWRGARPAGQASLSDICPSGRGFAPSRLSFILGTPKKGPREAGLPRSAGLLRSDRLGGGLGEVVLHGLRAAGDELAEIFAGRFRPRHENFTARACQIRLDLHRFVEALGGGELVDAGEERLGVLVDRLLDVAADLGRLADRISHGDLDRSRYLLRTGVGVGGALFGGRGRALDELAGSFGNFHVLEVFQSLGHRREGLLDAGEHGIAFDRHWVSPSSGLSYGLAPSGLARGDLLMPQLMVRCNNNIAVRHKNSDPKEGN